MQFQPDRQSQNTRGGGITMSEVLEELIKVLQEPNLDQKLILNEEARDLYLSDRQSYLIKHNQHKLVKPDLDSNDLFDHSNRPIPWI